MRAVHDMFTSYFNSRRKFGEGLTLAFTAPALEGAEVEEAGPSVEKWRKTVRVWDLWVSRKRGAESRASGRQAPADRRHTGQARAGPPTGST